MDTAEEVAQLIRELLHHAGYLPYVPTLPPAPAQPGYVVTVLSEGTATAFPVIQISHQPSNDDAHGHLQRYRDVLARGLLLPGVRFMLVVELTGYTLLLTWQGGATAGPTLR